MRIFQSKQFVKFILAGGSAAAINFGSRIVLNLYVSFSVSIAIAFVLGLSVAFILNKRLVFEDADQRTARQALIFLIVNLIALVQTYIISILLVEYIFPWWNYGWHTHEVAHLTGICFPLITSYIAHNYVTFKS
ncbi:GtrA family protein [Cohnella yongneupensis]|uniref:GtrA family protein n=1 Tax=Cohnella yongneupensis TaxID=425006 RepID=A0ABW0QVY3_9BACL